VSLISPLNRVLGLGSARGGTEHWWVQRLTAVALVPLGLEKIGVDPAVASSVVLTTVTDVVGFLAFLGLATIFLL